ncbi:MAG TPA: sigma factor-like helix-turn-helix DNA-binding protein [Blastocatellia bacterium]|nr:sigma factor-like helix-turn-helix DNA-binding protein [Blastocatellia bacterium]
MKQQIAFQDTEYNQQLSSAFGQFLYSHLQQISPTEAEAQDLEKKAQDQLLKVLEEGKANRTNVATLFGLAVTTLIATLRQAKQQQADRPLVWVELPALNCDDPQRLMQQLQEALTRLPEQRRRAVQLHLSGLTSAEIATLFDWSEAKARQKVEQGLHTLRKVLQKAGIDYEID